MCHEYDSLSASTRCISKNHSTFYVTSSATHILISLNSRKINQIITFHKKINGSEANIILLNRVLNENPSL